MIRNKRLLLISICLALVSFTIAAYWPVTHCGFVNFDDDVYVYENPVVKSGLSWKGIQWAFSSESLIKGAMMMWHPVVWVSLMLDHDLFGLSAYAYHLVNLLFHMISSLLLFAIFHRMTGSILRSAMVAGLFAIHPIHVESVAWISERKDVISAMFWMLTIGVYALYVEHPKPIKYMIAIVLFLMGLMAKPMIVTLPFVLILLDFWPLHRFDISAGKGVKWRHMLRLVLEKIPFFLLSLIFSVIGYASQKRGGVLDLVNTPVPVCIENALRTFVIYLQKTFWPIDLAVLYPVSYPFIIPSWQILGSLVILLSVTGFTLWTWKRYPYLLMGWLWYLGTLLPVIGIFQLGHQAYADRYTYIPLIGIFIMVIWGTAEMVWRIPYRKIMVTVGAATVFLGLAIVTRQQIGYWRDTPSLMNHAIETYPGNYMARWYLGTWQKNHGQWTDAITSFEESLKIDPVLNIYLDLAKMLWQQRRFDEALSYLRVYSNLDPQNAEAYNDMGIVFMSMNRKEQALAAFRHATEIDPNYTTALENLGRVLSSGK